MQPIGPLMIEHRLIERMMALIDRYARRMHNGGRMNVAFLDAAVDFISAYADRCHHGKEEGILFARLESKPLRDKLRAQMTELIDEHAQARRLTARLLAARGRHLRGDPTARQQVMDTLAELLALYPRHIEKEDKEFFRPAMEYLSQDEQAGMLEEFKDFDRRLIHEHYAQLIEQLESQLAVHADKG